MKVYLKYLYMIHLVHHIRNEGVSPPYPNIIVLFLENINEVMREMHHFELTSSHHIKNLADLKEDSINYLNVYGEMSSASSFASIFTGKSAVHVGLIRGKLLPFASFPSLASSGGLDVNEMTLAKALKRCGYHSWFTGYWKMGLGPSGDRYPMKHGFDTWLGVSQPHNEWCKPQNSLFNRQDPFSHPYLKLFYRTSFLWILLFAFITTLAWFKFISCRSYINLIVYTISTSFAFYVLLHLFMIQKSASCVLVYHDFVFQQPYDMNNLTMHFTQHSAKLVDFVAEQKHFFMVLNYLTLKQPYIFSNYFDQDQTRHPRIKSLLELDWSIGLLMDKLKKLNVYDNTMIVLTGSNSCNHDNRLSQIKAYKRRSKTSYESTLSDLMWKECFKVPLWIKNVKGMNETSPEVYTIASLTSVYDTVIQSCHCSDEKPQRSKNLINMAVKGTCADDEMTSMFSHYPKEQFTLAVPIEVNRSYYKQEQNVAEKEEFLFHYYDVHKPVMVTYKDICHVVYYQLNKFEELEKLDSPIIIDLTGRNNLDNIKLEEMYENVTVKLNEHMVERQSINLWSSQFEMPVYPWLMPCSNFPHCETDYVSDNDDFSYVMKTNL